MAMKSAWLRGAKRVIGVDVEPYRLEMARKASQAEIVNANEVDPIDYIREATEGRGADVCVDAVGMEAHRSLLDKAKKPGDGKRWQHGRAGQLHQRRASRRDGIGAGCLRHKRDIPAGAGL